VHVELSTFDAVCGMCAVGITFPEICCVRQTMPAELLKLAAMCNDW
jgi:hypothetical protein